ncbi:YoaK family protein [Streptomyces monashensis]|uniref:YoaK family protein n=1 Tax=Streptomyces monashensis TaxID=1678012 RepID=UPI001C42F361|nr:YoaK family protein [Streptomyces monashensis]
MRLGVLLALVGGGLDAYTFVGRGGVFANAQTGNVVLLGVAAAGRQWAEAVRHVPPIIAFVLGVLVAESLRRPRVAAWVRWPARAALVLEILVLFCVGLLPSGTADTAATVLVAFTASLQVATFRKLVDTAYSTAMTTGNLRTATQSAYRAVIERDRDAARRAARFSAVIGGFLAGACAGGLLTRWQGVHSVWALAGILALGLALFVHDERAAARVRQTTEANT